MGREGESSELQDWSATFQLQKTGLLLSEMVAVFRCHKSFLGTAGVSRRPARDEVTPQLEVEFKKAEDVEDGVRDGG